MLFFRHFYYDIYIKQYIEDIATEKGYEILAMKTDKDHIHFLIGYDCTDW